MKLVSLTHLNEHQGPFFFAVEEYLVKNLPKEDEYFFTWTLDPCVVIGRHQLLQSEVNEGFLSANGFPVWRRPSGGGAVYADRHCVMFSFITSHFNNQMVFDTYLGKVVQAFKAMGLEATFTGRNDLLYNGLKFSGNSFYRYQDKVVLHGTILYDVNIETLVKSITPSDEKLISKGITSVRQRVTNLKESLKISEDQMINQLQRFLCEDERILTEDELHVIRKLSERYASREWIYDQNPPYTFHHKQKFNAGTIELRLDIQHQKIRAIQWIGDFFLLQPLKPLEKALVGVDFNRLAIEKALEDYPVANFIHLLTTTELLELMFGKESSHVTI